MNKIRIIIADDQPLFAESLKYILLGEGKNSIDVVSIVENGSEAVSAVEVMKPDIVLMDIRMPVMDGIEATRIIMGKESPPKIMILTTFDDDDLAFNALTYGATGYILKNIQPENLIQSIKTIHSGNYCISPTVGYRILPATYHSKHEFDKGIVVSHIMAKHPNVTNREAEILYWLVQAYRNDAIADKLSISEKTVKNHLNSIFAKFSLHSRLDLMQMLMNELNTLTMKPLM